MFNTSRHLGLPLENIKHEKIQNLASSNFCQSFVNGLKLMTKI